MAWNDWGHFLTGGLGTKKGRNFLFGEDEKMKKFDQYSEGQNRLLSQMIEQLLGGGQKGYGDAMGLLQKYLDPNSQENQDFEEPYMRKFNEETIPGIAEQFARAGALSSSGFGQSLSAAGGRLQSDLASQKRQRMQEALSAILGQYNQQTSQVLGAQPFGYIQKQASPGFLGQFAGSAAKSYFGG